MENSHKQATEVIYTVEKQRYFPLYKDLGRNIGSPRPSLLFSVIKDDRTSTGAGERSLDCPEHTILLRQETFAL